jgi:hypothetical protein
MNDDFLYNNRPPLRKEFSETLYQRLSIHNSRQHVKHKGEMAMNLSIRKVATWKLIPVILLAITLMTFTFSGTVRANALAWIRSIAGFNIEEQSVSPLAGIDDSMVTVYPVPTLSVPDALKNPPFQFGLPTWVPEGYELDPNIAIANSKSWVMLLWHKPQQYDIELLIEKEAGNLTLKVGENSTEEIKINGQPAVLIRGNWTSSEKWDPHGGLTVGWIKDNHTYRLTIHSPLEGDTDAIVSQLVKMAQSIP